MTSRIVTLILLLVVVMPRGVQATQCSAIWPDRDTAYTSSFPTLPTFTGTTALTLNRTLGAGDFHYGASNLTSGDLTVNGGASTRLYFNGNVIVGGNTDLNQGGNPEDLIIVVNGDFNVNSSTNTIFINAIIYVTGNVNLSNSAAITGSVTAVGNISNVNRITYAPNAVANADFGTLCGDNPPELMTVSLACGNSSALVVSFNNASGYSPLNSSAEVIANYHLVNSGGTTIAITKAELADNGYEVILTLGTPLVSGTRYTLTVSNISDELGNTLASATDTVYATSTTAGILGDYFNNSTLTNPITMSRVDSQINFSWGPSQTPFGTGTNGFSMRWRGFIEPTTAGSYQFRTYSDDGVRLWVNDLSSSIIDNWTDHTATYNTATALTLTAGVRYPIEIEYYNRSANGEYGEIRLDWSRNGGAYSTVTSTNLYTCRALPTATNGLVVEYRMDGPVWNGTANEVLDSSGLGINGSIVNGTVNAPAKVCNGAVMNGTNFIRVPDNAALDLTDELTVTAWINLTQVGSELKSILSKDENYEFHIDNNRRIYWWWNSNAGTRSFDTGTTQITLGKWEHIAIVYRNGRQSIYLNGVEVAFRTYSGETLITNADPLEIGSDQGMTNRNWIGSIDEIRIYKRPLSVTEIQTVMNETRVCANVLDHFTVSAATTASVCAPSPVTITAAKSDGSTYTTYTGTVNISTSSNHGNWSLNTAHGTLSPNPDADDNGAVQYTFNAADNGVAVLALSNSHADQLRITATENAGTATGTSSTVTFSENAFQIDATDGFGTDFIAGRDHKLRVQALRRDPVSGSCGVFTEYNGAINLKGWITRSSADPAGAAPQISAVNGNVALPNSEPGANNLTLQFVSGVAESITLPFWKTTDVGQYTFNLKDNSSGLVKDVTGNPLTITGSSMQWTVRPFGFYLVAQSKDATPIVNPAASSAAGTKFVKAGAPFDVVARAVQYQLLDDSNLDGVPDAGVDLSDNGVTAFFGNEPQALENDVLLTYALLLPNAVGAHDPGLSGATAGSQAIVETFSTGQGTGTARFDEVGIISLSAHLVDNSYLGSGRDVTGTIAYVGRFYPAYFGITNNSPQLRDGTGSWTCNFTYQGQAFGFSTEPQITVQAYNIHDQVAENYSADFWKLNTPQHQLQLEVTSLSTGSSCESGGSVVAGCLTDNSTTVTRTWTLNTDYDGNGVLEFGTHVLTLNKQNVVPNAGDVPFDPLMDLVLPQAEITDSDGVCYAVAGTCSEYRINDIGYASSTNAHMRWGRGWVDSAVGSVISKLPMTLRLQYWNASQVFENNVDDDIGCAGTDVVVGDLSFDPASYSGNLQAGEVSVESVNGFPGFYVSLLTAPGYTGSTPNSGRVKLLWTVDAWLQFDFDGDTVADDPFGFANFVADPGRQPLLFMREIYR